MSFDLATARQIFIKGQLPESFGIDITAVEQNSVTGSLTVDERHLRPGNIMNGGVSLVLLETMGSISTCLYIDPAKFNAFGIQVNANHISVARPGDILSASSALSDSNHARNFNRGRFFTHTSERLLARKKVSWNDRELFRHSR